MAIIYKEATLAQSEIFKKLDKGSESGAGSIQNRALSLIKNAKRLTIEDIEAAYISVRQITDSLTKAALKSFTDGTTVLLYSDEPSLNITQAVPFMTLKKGGSYTTFVFMAINKYITVNRDGVMNVQPAVLRDLLTGAVLSNGIKRNYDSFASNQYIQNTLMQIYTQMVVRILNREYAIGIDKGLQDKIIYWCNKFFLANVINAIDSPENLENLAAKDLKYIDDLEYDAAKKQYNDDAPSTISEFLSFISQANPRMKTLGLGTFLSRWINYYYIPATLAIDSIEYLLFAIITILSGTNIVSLGASDIVKEIRGIKNLRGELLKFTTE